MFSKGCEHRHHPAPPVGSSFLLQMIGQVPEATWPEVAPNAETGWEPADPDPLRPRTDAHHWLQCALWPLAWPGLLRVLQLLEENPPSRRHGMLFILVSGSTGSFLEISPWLLSILSPLNNRLVTINRLTIPVPTNCPELWCFSFLWLRSSRAKSAGKAQPLEASISAVLRRTQKGQEEPESTGTRHTPCTHRALTVKHWALTLSVKSNYFQDISQTVSFNVIFNLALLTELILFNF